MDKYLLEPLTNERKAAIARTVLDDTVVSVTYGGGARVYGLGANECTMYSAAKTHAIEIFDMAFQEIASVTAVVVGDFSQIK